MGAITNNLNGKSFCFTGAAKLTRRELFILVEDNGGITRDTVSRGTDYLVLADPKSTSTKADKARSYGITLISEEDFMYMVEKGVERYQKMLTFK